SHAPSSVCTIHPPTKATRNSPRNASKDAVPRTSATERATAPNANQQTARTRCLADTGTGHRLGLVIARPTIQTSPSAPSAYATPPTAATGGDDRPSPLATIARPPTRNVAVAPPCQLGIRIRSTVGSSVTSVPEIVRETHPSTFTVMWARRSATQSTASWTAPLPIRAPSVPPDRMASSAHPYMTIGRTCRRFSPRRHARATIHASTAIPHRKEAPPKARIAGWPEGYPSPISATPTFTNAHWATTAHTGGAGV